eukprot:g7436.t2
MAACLLVGVGFSYGVVRLANNDHVFTDSRNSSSQGEEHRARVATLGDREKRRTMLHYFVPPPPVHEESVANGGVGRDPCQRKIGTDDVDRIDEEEATGSCIICFGDFTSGEELCRLPCLHLYHAKLDLTAETASIPPGTGNSSNTTTTTTTTTTTPVSSDTNPEDNLDAVRHHAI